MVPLTCHDEAMVADRVVVMAAVEAEDEDEDEGECMINTKLKMM